MEQDAPNLGEDAGDVTGPAVLCQWRFSERAFLVACDE